MFWRRKSMTEVGRSAIVVTPAQPFLDWLQSVDPTSMELTLADLGIEPTIYLIPECETPEDVADCLRDVFDEIFQNQLDGWYRVRETWPTNRSYEMFCRWFDYSFHSVLLDLG